MSRAGIGRRIRRSSVVACFILYAATASAVTTFGVPSCAAWPNLNNRVGNGAWLLGYLTAANDVWMALKPNPTGEPLDKLGSAEQIYRFMDDFCVANPAENVMTGAQKLFIELEKRATAK